MKRRKFIAILLGGTVFVGVILFFYWKGNVPHFQESRPNIVVISVDTLRADHVSVYGYGLPTTPAIDGLAASGFRFAQAYTTIPTTLPAHLAMFTGLYSSSLGITWNGLVVPESVETLAERLSKAGYRTAGFVSAAPLSVATGFSQGFQIYDEASGVRPGVETVAAAINWLTSERGQAPFFLFVHLFDPHIPYVAPKELRARFHAPDEIQPPYYGFLPDGVELDPVTMQKAVAAYDAAIAYADVAVGSLLASLRQLGLVDDTVVTLVADHGETLDELYTSKRYVFDHGKFLYTHQLHVPWIISAPFLNIRGVYEKPVSTLDLTPTLLELAGEPIPARLHGHSLVGVLRGTDVAHTPVAATRRSFTKMTNPYLRGTMHSLIKGKWHLLYPNTGKAELYNLSADPLERTNLISEEPVLAKRLIIQLKKLSGQLEPPLGTGVREVNPELEKRLRALGYVK